MPSLVEIGPVVLVKKMKIWKVYDNNNVNDNNDKRLRTTDIFWSEKVTWAFGSGELKQDWLISQKHYIFHNSFVYILSVIKLSWGCKSTLQLNDYNTADMALESILYDNKLKFLIPLST